MCLKLLRSQFGVDFLLPWTLCESFPWTITCSTGCFCFVLLCCLYSSKCPEGVDKDLRFCVTTIRECCLYSLSLYFSEITEDSATILVIQFFCLVEKWEVSLGLCLFPSQGNWLWEVAVLVSSLVSHRLLIWLGMHWLPHPAEPVFTAAAGSSQIRILRNYSSIILIPSALSEVKRKAGSNSIPGLLGPFKTNCGGKSVFNRQQHPFLLLEQP